MATTIVTKSGSGAPTASDLVAGELAVDLTNKRLYTEDSGGTVLELGTNPYNFTANHDGSPKLATTATGLDITGTATMDGLTVDGAATVTANLDVGADNGLGGKLSIQTSSYGVLQDMRTLVAGGINPYLTISSSADGITFEENGSAYKSLMFKTGASERMRITSSGNVGIGTASPFYTAANRSAVSINGTSSSILGFGIGDSPTAYLLSDAGGLTVANTSATLPTQFYTNSEERMRIDSSGNVGIGVAPEAWTAFNPVLRIKNASTGGGGALAGSGVDNFRMFANTYYDGAYKRLGVGFATQYGQESGQHVWSYAASGAADSTFTWSEAMRIDSSGNVGIGTSSLTGGNTILNLSRTGSGVGCNMQFANSHNGAFYVGLAGNTSGDAILHSADGTAGMAFGTGNTERMRIDASGNLLLGTSALTGSGRLSSIPRTAGGVAINTQDSVNYTAIQFVHGVGQSGTITVTASSTAYNTSSDQRLKENIADADDAGSKIDSIQVRKFDWKADGSHQDYGMVAQELLEVAPEAVSAPEDPEEMMGVDYSKLVPMMLKEIQSLRARVAQLES